MAKKHQHHIMINSATTELLLDMVIRGHGDKLIGRWSNRPQLQQFLDQVPYLIDRIEQIHLAVARRSTLTEFIMLIDNRQSLIRSSDQMGCTILHKAIMFNNIEIGEYLIDCFGEQLINEQDKQGRSPLHYAATLKDKHLYRFLLSHKNIQHLLLDNRGRTPMYYLDHQDQLQMKNLINLSRKLNANFKTNILSKSKSTTTANINSKPLDYIIGHHDRTIQPKGRIENLMKQGEFTLNQGKNQWITGSMDDLGSATKKSRINHHHQQQSIAKEVKTITTDNDNYLSVYQANRQTMSLSCNDLRRASPQPQPQSQPQPVEQNVSFEDCQIPCCDEEEDLSDNNNNDKQDQWIKRSASISALIQPCLTGNMVHMSIVNGDKTIVRKLLNNNNRHLINCEDCLGLMPLHKAVILGHVELVKLFIDFIPESINMIDRTGKTALHYAAGITGKPQRILTKLLIASGINPCIKDNDHHTAEYYRIHSLALPKEITLLLHQKNYHHHHHQSPSRSPKLVRLHSPNNNILDDDDDAAFDATRSFPTRSSRSDQSPTKNRSAATAKDGAEVYEEPRFADSNKIITAKQHQLGCQIPRSTQDRILKCLRDGSIEKINQLVIEGYASYILQNGQGICWNLNCRNYIKIILPKLILATSRLHELILQNDLIAVRHLLSHEPMLIKIRRQYKHASMNGAHFACLHNRIEIIQFIMDNFPEMIHLRDSHGATCLHIAAKMKSIELYNVLIEYGCSIAATDIKGNTPRDYFFEHHHHHGQSDTIATSKKPLSNIDDMLYQDQMRANEIQMVATKAQIFPNPRRRKPKNAHNSSSKSQKANPTATGSSTTELSLQGLKVDINNDDDEINTIKRSTPVNSSLDEEETNDNFLHNSLTTTTSDENETIAKNQPTFTIDKSDSRTNSGIETTARNPPGATVVSKPRAASASLLKTNVASSHSGDSARRFSEVASLADVGIDRSKLLSRDNNNNNTKNDEIQQPYTSDWLKEMPNLELDDNTTIVDTQKKDFESHLGSDQSLASMKDQIAGNSNQKTPRAMKQNDLSKTMSVESDQSLSLSLPLSRPGSATLIQKLHRLIRQSIYEDDINRLEHVIIAGRGQHLIDLYEQEFSHNSRTNLMKEGIVMSDRMVDFLKNIAPIYMDKIKQIHHFVKVGNLDSLMRILSKKRLALSRDQYGATPMHLTIIKLQTDIFRFLVRKYPESMSAPDNDGRVPMHYASIVCNYHLNHPSKSDQNYYRDSSAPTRDDSSANNRFNQTSNSNNNNTRESIQIMYDQLRDQQQQQLCDITDRMGYKPSHYYGVSEPHCCQRYMELVARYRESSNSNRQGSLDKSLIEHSDRSNTDNSSFLIIQQDIHTKNPYPQKTQPDIWRRPESPPQHGNIGKSKLEDSQTEQKYGSRSQTAVEMQISDNNLIIDGNKNNDKVSQSFKFDKLIKSEHKPTVEPDEADGGDIGDPEDGRYCHLSLTEAPSSAHYRPYSASSLSSIQNSVDNNNKSTTSGVGINIIDDIIEMPAPISINNERKEAIDIAKNETTSRPSCPRIETEDVDGGDNLSVYKKGYLLATNTACDSDNNSDSSMVDNVPAQQAVDLNNNTRSKRRASSHHNHSTTNQTNRQKIEILQARDNSSRMSLDLGSSAGVPADPALTLIAATRRHSTRHPRPSLVGGVIVPSIMHNDNMEEVECYDIIYRRSSSFDQRSNLISPSPSSAAAAPAAPPAPTSNLLEQVASVVPAIDYDNEDRDDNSDSSDDENERVERLSIEFENTVKREKNELKQRVDQIMNDIRMTAKSTRSTQILTTNRVTFDNNNNNHHLPLLRQQTRQKQSTSHGILQKHTHANQATNSNNNNNNKETTKFERDVAARVAEQLQQHRGALAADHSTGRRGIPSSITGSSGRSSIRTPSSSASSPISRSSSASTSASSSSKQSLCSSCGYGGGGQPTQSHNPIAAAEATTPQVDSGLLPTQSSAKIPPEQRQRSREEEGKVDLASVAMTVPVKNTYGQTYLHFISSRLQNSHTLYKILAHGCHLTPERDIFYRTMRDIASQFNLLSNVQVIDQFIIDAFVGHNIRLLKHLQHQGFAPLIHVADQDGNDIMLILKLLKSNKMIQFLQQLADFQKWRDELHTFIRHGYRHGISSLIKKHLDLVTCKSVYSHTSAHIATLFERIDILEELIRMDKKCLYATDNMGRTPLHYAYGIISDKAEDIRNLLIDAGSDQEARDVKMRTPKYYYVFKQEIQDIKKLEYDLV